MRNKIIVVFVLFMIVTQCGTVEGAQRVQPVLSQSNAQRNARFFGALLGDSLQTVVTQRPISVYKRTLLQQAVQHLGLPKPIELRIITYVTELNDASKSKDATKAFQAMNRILEVLEASLSLVQDSQVAKLPRFTCTLMITAETSHVVELGLTHPYMGVGTSTIDTLSAGLDKMVTALNPAGLPFVLPPAIRSSLESLQLISKGGYKEMQEITKIKDELVSILGYYGLSMMTSEEAKGQYVIVRDVRIVLPWAASPDDSIANLQSQDLSKRIAAEQQLLGLGADAVPSLVAELTSPADAAELTVVPDRLPRLIELATLLAKIGEPAFDSLLWSLRVDDADVRSAAAFALGTIGDGRATGPLTELAQNEKNATVRETVNSALEALQSSASRKVASQPRGNSQTLQESKKANDGQQAAMKTGFCDGVHLSLLTLPPHMRDTMAALKCDSVEYSNLLTPLGFNPGNIEDHLRFIELSRTQMDKARAVKNPVRADVSRAVNVLLSGYVQMTDKLVTSNRPELMRVYRIGWVLGLILQESTTRTSRVLKHKDVLNINEFRSTVQTYDETLPADLEQSRLPENLRTAVNTIRKIMIQVQSEDDMKKAAEACRDVLKLLSTNG